MVIKESLLETAIVLEVKDELGANPKTVPNRRKRDKKDFMFGGLNLQGLQRQIYERQKDCRFSKLPEWRLPVIG